MGPAQSATNEENADCVPGGAELDVVVVGPDSLTTATNNNAFAGSATDTVAVTSTFGFEPEEASSHANLAAWRLNAQVDATVKKKVPKKRHSIIDGSSRRHSLTSANSRLSSPQARTR